jgi:hypothetical protein
MICRTPRRADSFLCVASRRRGSVQVHAAVEVGQHCPVHWMMRMPWTANIADAAIESGVAALAEATHAGH